MKVFKSDRNGELTNISFVELNCKPIPHITSHRLFICRSEYRDFSLSETEEGNLRQLGDSSEWLKYRQSYIIT